MGPQVLIIPALFVLICATFIFLQSCYYRWKIGNAFRKKREAAKISLVNILQMTNPNLITPSWMQSQRKEKFSRNLKSPSSCSNFDPRNPKVLSSEATLAENDPPPCYEDLFGSGENAFVYSLEDNDNSQVEVQNLKEDQKVKCYQTGSSFMHELLVSTGDSHLQNVPFLENNRKSETPQEKSTYNSSIAVLHL